MKVGLATVLCATLWLVPGKALADTFGADLSAAPNNTETCAQFTAGQFGSCMFFSTAPGPSFYAPTNGTVTAVRVRTGNLLQGPMQVVVMRSLYQNRQGDPGHPIYACCFVEAYGPTFTPQANAVNTVTTSLAMQENPTPAPDDFTTIAADDFLALSVLAPNVPVPGSTDSTGDAWLLYAPAPTPGSPPAPSSNPLGTGYTDGLNAHLMLSADLDTGGGGGATPQPQPAPAPGPGTATAPLRIGSGGALRGRTATVPLVCVLTATCKGSLTLSGPASLAAKKAKTKVYGRSRYSVPAGKTKRIKVKLNAAGRRAARKHSRLTLTATTKIGSQVVRTRVKLRRAKHQRFP